MKRRYVGHYVDELEECDDLMFCTLTIDPKAGVPLEDARKYLIDCWQRWRKRIRRRCRGQGADFTYVATVEDHKSGFKHIHAIISAPLGSDTLREQWFEAGGGVVMDVQRVAPNDRGKLPRIVGYMVKYGFKDVQAASEGKYRRAVLASQGVGYHSARAKERRRVYAEKKRLEREREAERRQRVYAEEEERLEGDREAGDGWDEPWPEAPEERRSRSDAIFAVEGTWQVPSKMKRGEVPEYEDRITEADRERFDEYRANEARTAYYIDRDSEGPPVLHYRLNGEHHEEELPEEVTKAEITKIYSRVRSMRAEPPTQSDPLPGESRER